MPFKKGVSGNKEGRPKGAISKKTQQWEQLGEFITEEGAKRVMNYLNNLDDEDEFFTRFERLLNYFKPRLSSQQVKADIDATVKTQPLINFGDTSEKDAT